MRDAYPRAGLERATRRPSRRQLRRRGSRCDRAAAAGTGHRRRRRIRASSRRSSAIERELKRRRPGSTAIVTPTTSARRSTAFTICAFWYVNALAAAGPARRGARAVRAPARAPHAARPAVGRHRPGDRRTVGQLSADLQHGGHHQLRRAPEPPVGGRAVTRLVAVSNRVTVPRRGDAARRLAVGVLAAMQSRGGLWFGWSGETTEREPTAGRACVQRERHHVRAPLTCTHARLRRLLPRLLQRFAVAAVSLFPRRRALLATRITRPTSASIGAFAARLVPHAAARRPRLGARLPPDPARARACASSACASPSASSCTFRSRTSRRCARCRSTANSCARCSNTTSSASRRSATCECFRSAVADVLGPGGDRRGRQRSRLRPRARVIDAHPDRRRRRRHRSKAARRVAGNRRRSAHGRRPARAAAASSAWTASTTARASSIASTPTSGSWRHTRRTSDRVTFLQIAPLSRGDVRAYARDPPRARAGRRPHQRHVSRDTDWTPIRYLNRNYPTRRADGLHAQCAGRARDTAARRHEPRRQGIRGGAGSGRPGRAGPLDAGRRRPRARRRAARQPAATRAAWRARSSRPCRCRLTERRERHQQMLEVMRSNDIQAWHTRFVHRLQETGATARAA